MTADSSGSGSAGSNGHDAGAFWDQRAVRHGHTGWADPSVYRHDQPARLSAVERVLSRRGIDLHGCHVLDLGCGTGDFVELFLRRGARVTAVDISAEACARARRRFSDVAAVDVMQADLARTEFPEEVFDLVCSVTVLQHLPDHALESVLGGLARSLRPGGHVVALELQRRFVWAAGLTETVGRSAATWRSAFRTAGLTEIEVGTYPHAGPLLVNFLSRARGRLGGGRKHSSAVAAQGSVSMLKRLLLGVAYPFDRLLGIGPPSGLALYGLFVLRRGRGTARMDRPRSADG